jgi:hypothetical protein
MTSITYNEKTEKLTIKDGMQSQYFLLKIVFTLTLLNSILNVTDIGKTEFRFLESIWILLGLVSLVILYFLFFKVTGAEELGKDQIISLKEKTKYGKQEYYFLLKGNRIRALRTIKTKNEVKELRKLLASIGVAV